MRRITVLATLISVALLGAATPALAVDSYYQASLRGAKQTALGQSTPIVGWVDYRTSKGKTTARVTPLIVRVDSFGVGDPKGQCVGSEAIPNYCDDVVGGYMPDYRLQVTVTNRSKRAVNGLNAAIMCTDTTSGSLNLMMVSSTLPPRSSATETQTLYMPRGVKDPNQCAAPVLVLQGVTTVEAKQKKPVIPSVLYVPLTVTQLTGS